MMLANCDANAFKYTRNMVDKKINETTKSVKTGQGLEVPHPLDMVTIKYKLLIIIFLLVQFLH